ncbi:hypothetical protein CY652_07820 [Burkholderia sp. WAC0059]|nr:hypothetical protein CY652_07820 [Burkholderia sp. WAC0059]
MLLHKFGSNTVYNCIGPHKRFDSLCRRRHVRNFFQSAEIDIERDDIRATGLSCQQAEIHRQRSQRNALTTSRFSNKQNPASLAVLNCIYKAIDFTPTISRSIQQLGERGIVLLTLDLNFGLQVGKGYAAP